MVNVRPRATTVACAGILLLAAGLRFWGLDFGLPNPHSRPDEREALAVTAGFVLGDFNPHWFVYPNLFFYVTWAWIQAVLRVSRLWHPSLPSYANLLTNEIAVLLYAGRLLSAVVGTATVWLLWRIARAAGGVRLGLAAAALLATAWLHVRDSHAIKTEALLAAGVLVSVWRLACWVERPRRGAAVAAGIAIGVTMGFKYPGIFLAVPAWVATMLVSPRRGLARTLPTIDLGVMLGTAAVVFVATNPFLFVESGRTSDTALLLSLALYAPRPDGAVAASSLAAAVATWFQSRAFAYHVLVSFRHGVGLIATLLLPLALLRSQRAVPPVISLAAVFVATYYPIAGASPVHLARYVTPLVPLIALLVAALLTALTDRLPPPLRGVGLCLAVALVCAEPLANVVQANTIAARTDTRVLATAWMAGHLPPGARVAQMGGTIVPTIGEPLLPRGMERMLLLDGETDLSARGITHVVTQEHPLPFSQLDHARLDVLAPRLTLLATFSPWTNEPVAAGFEREDAYYLPFFAFAGVERGGPLLRVWAVR